MSSALIVTPVIDGTDGPSHDEPREEVEDGREIELAAAADHKLRRVADPSLIRSRRLEPTIQEIGGHRLIVIAHRGALEPRPSPRLKTVFLHQTNHALATDALVLLDQIFVSPRAAIPLAALIEGCPHQDAQPAIGLRVRGLGAPS
jgi:hypothetical protein